MLTEFQGFAQVLKSPCEHFVVLSQRQFGITRDILGLPSPFQEMDWLELTPRYLSRPHPCQNLQAYPNGIMADLLR